MKTPELLSPAGTLKSMRHAYAFGADAVYAGLPKYSLRARNNEFKRDALVEGIALARTLNKKIYATCNILPHNGKVDAFVREMTPMVELKPDALIMSDAGLMMLAREAWPEMPIHLSVQANTMNYAAIKFWARNGVSRIILSRELSLEEIERIRQECPDTEIEVFIHGALCIAYSGRCLLSGYFNKRDSNQGVCTNACRWNYSMHHADAEHEYLLEEAQRPGEMMPIIEDEHGTYIMNSKDLNAIGHVKRLVEIGVDSLKIEGRTKSHYYVARTAQAYRAAIDAAVAGQDVDAAYIQALQGLANRGYTSGFFSRKAPESYQTYETGSSLAGAQKFVAEAAETQDKEGWLRLDVKNNFKLGDQLCLITPKGNFEIRLQEMHDVRGNNVEVAPGSGYKVYIPYDGARDELILITRIENPAPTI